MLLQIAALFDLSLLFRNQESDSLIGWPLVCLSHYAGCRPRSKREEDLVYPPACLFHSGLLVKKLAKPMNIAISQERKALFCKLVSSH